jgi:hypothetical protein
MSQADLVIDMTANQSEHALPHALAVLIEVPAINPLPIARAPRTIPRGAPTAGQRRRYSRRRLRREVSLAGCALIALVPIVSACTLGWSNRPDRIVACAIPDPLQSQAATDRDDFFENRLPAREGRDGQAAIAPSGAVVLSIEPAAAASGSAAETPVIFPGYVLPDDSREDSLHEGS